MICGESRVFKGEVVGQEKAETDYARLSRNEKAN
jgi:hypothetical protein